MHNVYLIYIHPMEDMIKYNSSSKALKLYNINIKQNYINEDNLKFKDNIYGQYKNKLFIKQFFRVYITFTQDIYIHYIYEFKMLKYLCKN